MKKIHEIRTRGKTRTAGTRKEEKKAAVTKEIAGNALFTQ